MPLDHYPGNIHRSVPINRKLRLCNHECLPFGLFPCTEVGSVTCPVLRIFPSNWYGQQSAVQ